MFFNSIPLSHKRCLLGDLREYIICIGQVLHFITLRECSYHYGLFVFFMFRAGVSTPRVIQVDQNPGTSTKTQCFSMYFTN